MILTLLDVTAWTCKKLYNGIYYVIWGDPQTKLLADVERKLEEIEKLLKESDKNMATND